MAMEAATGDEDVMGMYDKAADVDLTGLGGDQATTKVHVRIQMRSGRKSITLVEGLDDDLDLKKICKYFRKNFKCNGTVVRDIEKGDVIQLQGDQRKNVQSFMVQFKICDKERIVLHGF